MITAGQVGLADNGLRTGDKALGYARTIVTVAVTRGLDPRAADIAVQTALTESLLTLYANASNPDSLALPHDAVGDDHGSVGLFQQQVGGAPNSTADWGTTADCMNPTTSAGKFYDRLDGWVRGQGGWGPQFSNTQACQGVQGSAFPTAYQRNDAQAIAIVDALWPEIEAGQTQTAPSSGGGHTVEEDDVDLIIFSSAKDPKTGAGTRPGIWLHPSGLKLPLHTADAAASLTAAGARSVTFDDATYVDFTKTTAP